MIIFELLRSLIFFVEIATRKQFLSEKTGLWVYKRLPTFVTCDRVNLYA